MQTGSLMIVGTGIQLGHLTLQAQSHIIEADKVIYLVTDPVTEQWIRDNNETAESLNHFYSAEKDRLSSYMEMVEHILQFVRQNQHVCAVFYGHPGVFVLPSHEAVRQAQAEGYLATMMPGISAEDCLFSDLGIDPATSGCQSFEATDFLVHQRQFDPTSHLVIWQIGVIGDIGYREHYSLEGLKLLVNRLLEDYPPDHPVTVYEAARYVVCDPKKQTVALKDLASADISPISTLYIPPARDPVPSMDMIKQLGIPQSYIKRKQDVMQRPAPALTA